MSKILFIDVDGTLCSPTLNRPPESAKKAIRAARENGHKVYICTGRSMAELYEDILEIGFDGIIGGNGCYVEDHGNVILHQKLTAEECAHVVDWCHERHMEFYLECNSGLYPSERYKEVSIEAAKKRGIKNPEYGEFFKRMIYGADPYRDDVNKISFRLNSWEDYLAACEEFKDLKVGCWGGDAPNCSHGDVSPQGINKANAINKLLEYLGETSENTIAFGDEAVDIPMFELCGYSVAMGSGNQSAKDAADYITTGTDDDGLLNAFVHLGLITE